MGGHRTFQFGTSGQMFKLGWGQSSRTICIGTPQNIERTKELGGWYVGQNGLYIPLWLSTDLSLDSESKLEPSVAKLKNMKNELNELAV